MALFARFRTLSLAQKCLLLFGGAATLIILIALSLPWLRMNSLVSQSQVSISREIINAWEWLRPDDPGPALIGSATLKRLSPEEARADAPDDRFVGRALERFERSAEVLEHTASEWDGVARLHRYAKPVRDDEGALTSVVVMERRSDGAAVLMLVNTLYVMAAGSVVLAVALVVFYVITGRLILDPVRSLRETAESVRDGHLDTRSTITTGDEFQELADTFNLMLVEIEDKQDQLRAINAAMDVKLTELAEANTTLFETARLKGEFLASVSHELRTPLNSIIGFAELLLEIARAETGQKRPDANGDPSGRALQKRVRYLEHIVTAGRNLLEMIESLLEMAKIEAGRIELHPEPISLRETCQGLVGLIHPLAQRKGIEVRLDVAEDVPVIETDPKKFQQIVFNLLSNAVKFIDPESMPDRRPEIVVRVECLPGLGPGSDEQQERVRVSVIDNGPGISREDQQRVFEKFQQLDTGHTRGHAGTGLGLAICRELTAVLQGEIQLVSDLGRGSMFSLIFPRKLDPGEQNAGLAQARSRGMTSGRRPW